MAFKDRLKKLREEKNLTQKQLAEKIFVSRSTVAKWENGLGIPCDVNLEQLCSFFNVSEEELLSRKDLKEGVKMYKEQKNWVVLGVLNSLLPLIFAFFSLLPLYEYNFANGPHIAVVVLPISIFNCLKLWSIIPFAVWFVTFAFAVLKKIFIKNKVIAQNYLKLNKLFLFATLAVFVIALLVGSLIAYQKNYVFTLFAIYLI